MRECWPLPCVCSSRAKGHAAGLLGISMLSHEQFYERLEAHPLDDRRRSENLSNLRPVVMVTHISAYPSQTLSHTDEQLSPSLSLARCTKLLFRGRSSFPTTFKHLTVPVSSERCILSSCPCPGTDAGRCELGRGHDGCSTRGVGDELPTPRSSFFCRAPPSIFPQTLN